MTGLTPALLARGVERQDAVHVAVVGDAERRLLVGRGRLDELVDPGGAVEHRELGVGVEVDEALPVSHPCSVSQLGLSSGRITWV